MMRTHLGYWAPYLLAAAGALLALVSAAPGLVPTLGLRRWYQRATILTWIVFGLVVLLTVVVSSPWLAAGLVLVGLAATSLTLVQGRLESNMEEEALAFLQALAGLMAANESIQPALLRAAQDADFERSYPRMVAQVRQIVGYVDAGRSLTEAVALVGEAVPRPARRIGKRIGILARMVDEEGGKLSIKAQRDTLQSLWAILLEIHNINADLRREMSSMELAKWIFTLIIPGLNLFMARFVESYTQRFLFTPLGQATLVLEGVALISIFYIFSRLQRLPEVRL